MSATDRALAEPAHQPLETGLGRTEGFRADFERDVVPLLPELRECARSIVGSSDAASDVVQDVILRLWSHGFLPSRAAPAMRNLVARRSLHHLRSLRRRHDHEGRFCSGNPCVCSAPGPEESAVFKETRALLRGALDSLDDHQREVLELHLNGCDYGEVALRLRVPIGTVRSRLNRARTAFARTRGGRRLAQDASLRP